MPVLRLPLVAALCAATTFAADFRPPAGDRFAVRRVGAESVLPGGRMVEPLGRQFVTGPGAFGLAISPDGRYVVTADSGPGRASLTVLDTKQSPWTARQIKARDPNDPFEHSGDDDWLTVFMGLAFESNDRLFASEGTSGRVRQVSIPSGRLNGVFDLNQGDYRDSFSGDLAFDAKRNLLFVVDQANFRVAIFNTRNRRLIASVRVGRLPFKLTLSPDQKRLYVTNTGTFQYAAIPSADLNDPHSSGLAFPAFGFPSADAERGATRETARGPVEVPGLGDPNVPESNSLCVVDVENAEQPRVVAFVRTGKPIGGASAGGSGPTGVVASPTTIFVANANQDTISVIDAVTLRVRAEIPLRINGLEDYRGVVPVGLHLDIAANRLLVAEAGINAIGVVDVARSRLVGHIPAGWFPTAVDVHDNQVFVASAKGLGAGPSASRNAPLSPNAVAELRRGALSAFEYPQPRALMIHTERVSVLNGFNPLKRNEPRLPSSIKHVVVILKEGRSFDEVLGGIQKASNGAVNGAPELARLGGRGWITQQPGELKARADKKFYNLTPNHQAFAARFAISDNFYAAGARALGIHWASGVYPGLWTESIAAAAPRHPAASASAPGRLLEAGVAASVLPEELAEQGTLWSHLERHKIAFRAFGLGLTPPGSVGGEGMKPTGTRVLTNVPVADSLYRHASRAYPAFNTNIPDQFRAQQFIGEIEESYVKANVALPQFMLLHLPNDATARARPSDGYPFSVSYVADNDYALGRIVEYLSKSKWWNEMAIFVVGSSVQGADHVDLHRAPLLVISPYAQPNYVQSVNTDFSGVLKTAFRLLNVPPLNLYDATAADVLECLTGTPNFEPYIAIAPDPDVFVPEAAKDPADPETRSTIPGLRRR